MSEAFISYNLWQHLNIFISKKRKKEKEERKEIYN